MSCNHCATASAGPAQLAGAPEIEANWAGNRQHPQVCPKCHAFLRADGGCTRCGGQSLLAPPINRGRQSLDAYWSQYSPEEQARMQATLDSFKPAPPLPSPLLPPHLDDVGQKAQQKHLFSNLVVANNYSRLTYNRDLSDYEAEFLLDYPGDNWMEKVDEWRNAPNLNNPQHFARRLDTPPPAAPSPLPVSPPPAAAPSPPPPTSLPQSQIATRPVKPIKPVKPCHRCGQPRENGVCLSCQQEIGREIQKLNRAKRGLLRGGMVAGTAIGGGVGALALGGGGAAIGAGLGFGLGRITGWAMSAIFGIDKKVAEAYEESGKLGNR